MPMEWKYSAEPVDRSQSVGGLWRPTGVVIVKSLVDDSGAVLTSTETTAQDAINNTDHVVFAEEFLAVVRSHFDAQYDKLYTEWEKPMPALCMEFGQALTRAMTTYRYLESGAADD